MDKNRALYLCIISELIENIEFQNKWKLKWALDYSDNFYKAPNDNETIEKYKHIIGYIKDSLIYNDPDFIVYFSNKIARKQIENMKFSLKRQVFVAIADFSTQKHVFKRIKQTDKEKYYEKIIQYIYGIIDNG